MDIYEEITDIVKDEVPKYVPDVVFPAVQRVEVINPSETSEIDLSGLESILTQYLAKETKVELKTEKTDTSRIERSLTDIARLISDIDQVDNSDILQEIVSAIANKQETEHIDYSEDFEKLINAVKEIKVSNSGGSSAGSPRYLANPAGTIISPATEEKQNYLVGMEIPAHNHLALTEASLTDTWVYKTGGASGTTVATVLITYTDSGKGTIATIAKT